MQHAEVFDVVIAGGGPAGLAALHWCLEFGLNALLLERETECGGQLLHIYNPVVNYPGVTAANGRGICDQFLQTMQTGDGRRITGVEVIEADLAAKTFLDARGKCYQGRALIIATGVRRRELGIPGELEFRGRGVISSGAKERDLVVGKRVVVIGGGDAALENALILSELAARVYVLHRRSEFTARKEFIDAAAGQPNIEFITDAQAVSIRGNSSVEAVEVEHLTTNDRHTIAADSVLIRIGVVPNTEMFRGQAKMDRAGYLTVDRNCATNVAGVFAAGDVANSAAPTISGAVGDGATAVRAVFDHIK
jgi:thioredoxin reductase (NADPH)